MSNPIILLHGGKYILKGNEFLVRGSTITYNYKENTVIIDTPEKVISMLLYDARGVDGHLNVVGCSSLQELTCSGNLINTINASGCTELTTIFCAYNDIEVLDITGCSKLSSLIGYENNITSFSATGCILLNNLLIRENLLTYVNIIDCINMTFLDCRDNLLTSLDVTKCVNLKILTASENKLPSLDVSDIKSLFGVFVENNLFTDVAIDKIIVDLSKTKLEGGYCYLGKNPQLLIASLSPVTKTAKENMEKDLNWTVEVK